MAEFLKADTRGDAWTVFRARPGSGRNVSMVVLGAMLGCLFAGYGVAAVRGSAGVPIGIALFAIGLAAFGGSCFTAWTYYVAIDQQHLTVGRVRRVSAEGLARRDIAYATWKRKTKTPHGVLRAADGRPLLRISQTIDQEQMARIAEHLGIPFELEPK